MAVGPNKQADGYLAPCSFQRVLRKIGVTLSPSHGQRSVKCPLSTSANRTVARLSADGLRMFLFVIYEIYARRVEEVSFHLLVLNKALGVLRSQLKPLAQELLDLGLLTCEVSDERIIFRLPETEPIAT
jgi:hypothetical protein